MARDARKEEMIALKITPKFNRGLSPINPDICVCDGPDPGLGRLPKATVLG
jgi:hypothetical protein